MVGYDYLKNDICLLLGSKEVFNEKTDKFEYTEYEACVYSDGLPVDGSCRKCSVYKNLEPEEIDSKLNKKPKDL